MARIDIDGMTCAVCVGHVEKAIRSVTGIESVSVNLAAGTASFSGDVNTIEVIDAINSSGYIATEPIDFFKKWELQKVKSRTEIIVSSISLLIALISMYYLMFIDYQNLTLGILAMIIVVTLNHHVIIKGVKSLYSGVNMYTLVLIAFMAGLSWSAIYPEYAMWEATFIVIAFVGFGDSLESLARVSATSSFAELSAKTNDEDIELGDEVSVSAGQVIPVDGVVISGKTDVEQSAITGESIPVTVSDMDQVWAGSTVIDGSITIRATCDSGASRIDEVVRLVENAQSEKAAIEKTVDKIARYFVPVVITLAILTFYYWRPEHGDEHSLMMAISVLVIACPCAMGLATPISLFVGTSTGAKNGILLKGHKALEAASKIETVVLDKTGTLTTGLFSIECDDDEALKIAASLEAHTSHPIAVAILKQCTDYYDAQNVKTVPGWGVKGEIDGEEYSVGKGDEVIEVRKGDQIIGTIFVKDTIRSDAKEAISQLPRVILSSGDHQKEVDRVAGILGIQDARYDQLPSDKLELIESLDNVAMVGDGINDAAALAAADLGIAVASSTGIANSSSDIVLTRDGVISCVDALDLANRTRSNIRQNLFWAFAYNVTAIPIAMGVLYPVNGFLMPTWAAAAAMSLSSMCVILNAIRLRWSFERGMIRRRYGGRTTV